MKKIPCVMMRGGTSRGAFLLAEHLPEDQTQRDKILMAIMGSGNDLEIDGIGGGNPLTSKVAIISRSSDPRADVDYLFAQVIVHEQRVDTTPNCGNMLSGVGAFAIENGLIAATSPVTRVRIRNVNTGTFIEADVQTPNGVVEYEGSARIDGVPGTAAPVALTFLNAAGTKTGKVFPTDNQIDYEDLRHQNSSSWSQSDGLASAENCCRHVTGRASLHFPDSAGLGGRPSPSISHLWQRLRYLLRRRHRFCR